MAQARVSRPRKEAAEGEHGVISQRELVDRISESAEVPKEYVSAVLRSFKQVVSDALLAGRTIDLGKDFGRFTVITVRARAIYVPSRGEHQEVGARRKVRFRPSSKALKVLAEE